MLLPYVAVARSFFGIVAVGLCYVAYFPFLAFPSRFFIMALWRVMLHVYS